MNKNKKYSSKKKSKTSTKYSAKSPYSKKKSNYKSKKKTTKNREKRKLFVYLIMIVIVISVFRVILSSDSDIKREEVKYYTTDEFIRIIEPYVKKEYKKSGILPSITLSQAILESNSGNSRLTREGNNLFGIKAGKSWKGDTIKFVTEENHKEYIKAYFRKYKNWEESIDDHTKLLQQNPVYKRHGLFKTKKYEKQAQALEDAGYATKRDSKGNKIYADILIDVIKKYELYKYDIESFE